jgi:hypothetical protein
MLTFPQSAIRPEGKAIRVTMTKRPNLAQCAGCCNEWIVGGDRAVGVQTNDLAKRVIEGLRGRINGPVADCNEKVFFVRRKRDASAKLTASYDLRGLSPDYLAILERRRRPRPSICAVASARTPLRMEGLSL